MELRQLKYFVAVAEERHFTRAAARCRIAQPSLSEQIRKLEEELGEPLFHRHPRRIELTEAGVATYQRARALLAQSEGLRAAFADRRALLTGTVHVGIIPTIAPYLIPPAVAAFLGAHPGVSIRLHEAKTSQLLPMLAAGEIDLAVASDVEAASRRRASIGVKELFREPLVLAVPENRGPAGHRRTLAVHEIPRERLMILREGHCLGDQVLRLCRERRDAAHLECEQLETLLGMVAAGLGVAVVPEMAAHHQPCRGVSFLRLGPPEPQRVISVLRLRGARQSPAAERFIEHLVPQ